MSNLPHPRTAVDLLRERVRRMPDDPLFEVRDGPRWRVQSASAVWERVEGVARGLIAAGIGPGDRVGIMSRTRHEWLVADFALWSVGAVPVPLYESSSAAQIDWITRDAGLVALFVEDDEMRRRATEASPDLIADGRPWVFAEGALDRLSLTGGTVPPERVRERRAGLTAEDLATIVYTSGTTGRPRGVRITHGSLAIHAASSASALRSVFWDGEPRLLLFLPLAHVYARMIALVCVASRTTLGFGAAATDVAADARSFRPTFLVVVPRVLEKVYAAAEATAAGPRARIFAWARTRAERWSRAEQLGTPPVSLRIGRAVADVLVLRRLRRALGGRLRTVIVGGAALHPPLAHFFRGAGIDVLEGYGLTETCAQTTVNRPGRAVVGSVGTPLPGCRVRIVDGEIEIAGPHVFAGYEGEAPREGEWFGTGDVGRLDSSGALHVTGRIKDVLVTAGGKNVSPGPLEDAVRAHPLVAECLVVGEGRPFVAALLFPDEERLAAWCAERGRPSLDPAAADRDPELRAELTAAVARANASVSLPESIREFAVVGRPLTVAGGEMTPSLKVRRARVLTQLAPVVDELYARAATRREGTTAQHAGRRGGNITSHK